MVRLNPSAAAAEASSATLIVPTYANGAFSLQLFGAAAQPLLQIVPVLRGYDEYGSDDTLYLFGAGFVEGASTYGFAGKSVADTAMPAPASVVLLLIFDCSSVARSCALA
jgi:hypothetical protein